MKATIKSKGTPARPKVEQRFTITEADVLDLQRIGTAFQALSLLVRGHQGINGDALSDAMAMPICELDIVCEGLLAGKGGACEK